MTAAEATMKVIAAALPHLVAKVPVLLLTVVVTTRLNLVVRVIIEVITCVFISDVTQVMYCCFNRDIRSN